MGTLRSDGPPTNLPAVVSDCRNALAIHQADPSPSSMAALHAEASRVIDAAYDVPAVEPAPAPTGWHQVEISSWPTTEPATYTSTMDTTGPGYAGTRPWTCSQHDCPNNCPLNGTGAFQEYAYYRDNGWLK